MADTPLGPASGSAAETPGGTPESMADALLFKLDGERFARLKLRPPRLFFHARWSGRHLLRSTGVPLRWHGLMQAAVEAFGGSVTLDPAA